MTVGEMGILGKQDEALGAPDYDLGRVEAKLRSLIAPASNQDELGSTGL